MKIYKKQIYTLLIMLILGISYIIYLNNTSYGYFTNINDVRSIISNISGFYYDRGNYIQYDDSYLNEKVKRINDSFYPDIANGDNIMYMNGISFINNVFITSINYDLKDLFGELSLDNIKKYGNDIYSNYVLDGDDRVNVNFTDNNQNNYVIDYYDNTVTKTTATIGDKIDYHILIMYVNNNDLDANYRDNIYNKLLSTLQIGDIIVYKNYILLYVGNNRFIYCDGDSYDYLNGKDNKEDRAIKYGNISLLNNSDDDKYLFDGDNFYVYRVTNLKGVWLLPNMNNKDKVGNITSYFSNDIVPKIRIERYSSINEYNDVYENEEINYTIKIFNNTNDIVTIPSIVDDLPNNVIYQSNSFSEESYNNGILTFNDIKIEGNSYIDINYVVKVNDTNGYVEDNDIMMGNYPLRGIKHKIGKKISDSKIINNYKKYDNVISMYKNVFKIELDNDMWSKVLDSNGNYIDGYDLLVGSLYGGSIINSTNDIVRYVDKNRLMIGDIIYYDDRYLLYIGDYLYDYSVSNVIDIDSLLNSLISKNKYMVIRPSRLYNDKELDFGDLDVDINNNLIRLKTNYKYDDIINKISNYEEVIVRDKNSNIINTGNNVKTGEMVIIDNETYYISLLGDINGDGYIDTSDVLKLHRYVLGKTNIGNIYYFEAGLLNNDNNVDTSDVLKLHRYVLGKIKNLG